MNENMFFHPVTQKNIAILKSRGVNFIEPDKGYLACRDEGWGRLASPERIVEKGLDLIGRSRSLKGKTVLVTAGPTREPLDPVRYLSNRSSGKMGYCLAEEACKRGAHVILISGPSTLYPPAEADLISVETAKDMEKAVLASLKRADIIIMAAAVSDFSFNVTIPEKVKKDQSLSDIQLVKTPDILERLGKEKGKKLLVGFAAETNMVRENALSKMKKKNLDLIVANDVSKKGIGFDSDYNDVYIIFSEGKEIQSGKKTKSEISRMILDSVEEKLGKKIGKDPH